MIILRNSFILMMFIISFSILKAQTPTSITAIPNETVSVKGDLSEGGSITDLSWAWNSSVACFPETQKSKFTGHHVLYTTEIPTYSEMEITVVPENQQANFSIYAYQLGANTEGSIVPDLAQCIRCEVDHKWDRAFKGRTQDHTRTAKDLVAINRPYKVIIGVVGADGLDQGAYTLQISTKSR